MENRFVVVANGATYETYCDLQVGVGVDAELETLMSNLAVNILKNNHVDTRNIDYSACLYDEQNDRKAKIKSSKRPLPSLKITDL